MAVAAQTMTGAPALERVGQRTQRVPAQERPAALPALTGLRFVAALSVVVGHWLVFWMPASALAAGGPGVLGLVHAGLWRLLTAGNTAVTLFFVLSGYILAHTYLPPSGRMRGSARSFFVARFARIYPLYACGLLLALGPYLGWGACASGVPGCAASPRLVTFLASLSLTQAWNPGRLVFLNGPGWSLSCEAFFYALFPLLALGLGRAAPRTLWLVAALALLADLAPPLCYLLASRPAGAGAPSDPWVWAVTFAPPARLGEFVLGLVAARLSRPGRLTRSARGAGLPLVPIGTAGALAAITCTPDSLGSLGHVIAAPFLALLVCGLAAGRGRLAAGLGRPVCRRLGEASYGLYILHWPLWLLIVALLGLPAQLPARAPALALGPLAIALMVAVSLVAYTGLECPARALLRRAWASEASSSRTA